jgi:error-prone DNA polymerase
MPGGNGPCEPRAPDGGAARGDEGHGASCAAGGRTRRRHPAVRLGLATVRGLGERHEEGVRAALASVAERGPFSGPEDFARRTGVPRPVLEHLARLGAFAGFEQERRRALWRVARLARVVPGPLAAPAPAEGAVPLREFSAAEAVREDLLLGGATTGRHPVELLREGLAREGVLPASALALPRGGAAARDVGASEVSASSGRSPRAGGAATVRRAGGGASAASSAHQGHGASRAAARPFRPRQGARVRVAGMVICRQRPPTARGLTFMTLEDETGFANLVVMPDVAARERAGLHAALVLAEGRLEVADGVVNVRAERLAPLDGRLVEGVRSHDYR